MAMINAYPGDWAGGERGLAALPDRAPDFVDSLERTLDYAQAAGAPRVHLLAGLAPAQSGEARATYLRSVRLAAERFARLGVTVLLEPINPSDMPGYFLNDFDQAAQVLAEIDLPGVRLQFDVYHRQRIHGEVERGLRRLIGLVGHVQVASAPDRAEPDHGEVDYAQVFETLDALGYDRVIGCEYRPAAGTVAGLSWLDRYRPAAKEGS